MRRTVMGIVAGLFWGLVAVGCIRTEPTGSLHLDVDAGEDVEIQQGEVLTLQATVAGRGDGVSYRWNFESGPDVEIADQTGAEAEFGPFDTEGEYKFRVVASTAAGDFGQDFVIVTVSPSSDLCAGVTCDDGQECDAETGECQDVDPCADVVCDDGQICNPATGECRDEDEDLCADVVCEDNQFCDELTGLCEDVDLCADVACDSGQTCDPETGECREEVNLCEGVVCEEDELCVPATGECEPVSDVILPSGVVANAPGTLSVDDTGTLSANNPPAGFDGTYNWVLVSGEATIEDTTARETSIEADSTGTVTVQVNMAVDVNGESQLFSDTTTIEVVSSSTLRTRIAGPSDTIAGDAVALSANIQALPTGGGASFTWEVLQGEGTFDPPQGGRQVTFTPTTDGEVIVQINGSVSGGSTMISDQHKLVVYPDLTIDLEAIAENLVVLDESTALELTATNFDDADVLYAWQVVSGMDVELADEATRTPDVTARETGTAELEVTAAANVDGLRRTGRATLFVTSVADLTPQVVVEVEGFGQIPIELSGADAPITVANFLHYVDDGHYDGQLFHRVVPDFVIQAGGFRPDGDGGRVAVESRDPIPNEADNGRSNLRSTVAMALLSNQPESGDQGWFVNLVDDNVFLDEMQHTVFGDVVGEGMEVVDAIAGVEVQNEQPAEQIVIGSVRRSEGP